MTPQPPRDGEPDPKALAQSWLDLMGDGDATHTNIKADDLSVLCNAVLSHQRPQPKVGDAEVADAARWLRNLSANFGNQRAFGIADLLERIASRVGFLEKALGEIAEGRDSGRHDGLPEEGPAHDADVMFAIARAALHPTARPETEDTKR